MSQTHLLLKVAGLAILALWFAGCSTSPDAAAAREQAISRWQTGPLVDEQGHHRSLVLDHSAQHDLVMDQPWRARAEPWYTGRLDREAQVAAGYRSAIVSRSVTVTRDGTRTGSRGRVYDDFRTRTTTIRALEVIQ